MELTPKQSEFLLYTSREGDVRIDVILQEDTVWLTQKSMGELFGVESHTINYHLKEIYKSNELDELATTRKIRAVQQEGHRQVTRNLDFYNLDAIISVGYRVNSNQATQFRIWATKILTEYLIKGFALDDQRLKQGGQMFGKDYFEELLERIREIRASERRFYQKMTDWIARLDAFLQFNEYDLLQHPGKVSHVVAKATAEEQFEKFRVVQDKNYASDFDREVKHIAERNQKKFK